MSRSKHILVMLSLALVIVLLAGCAPACPGTGGRTGSH